MNVDVNPNFAYIYLLGGYLTSSANTSQISLISQVLSSCALCSSITLPILVQTKALRLCLRQQSLVNMGPGPLFEQT
jgi:hypothetical protein